MLWLKWGKIFPKFSFAEHFKDTYYGRLFIYLLPNIVCMYVCLFVIKRGAVTFNPNNAKFTLKIDVCTGQVINFDQKRCRIG